MSIQFSGERAPFLASSGIILQEHGITLTTGSDFKKYAEVLKEERPLQKLGAPFDPTLNELDAKSGFWVLGRNQSGVLVHTQAFKTVDLTQLSLSTYLLRSYRKFPPPLPEIDFDRSRFRATPGSHRISGQTVYHGEVWMAPDAEDRYRGQGLSTVLTRFGLLEAMNRWDPDWIFGFMLRAVAFKGFSERVGYMHVEPGALKWAVKDRTKLIEAFLVYLSREDAQYMLEMPVEELVSHAA